MAEDTAEDPIPRIPITEALRPYSEIIRHVNQITRHINEMRRQTTTNKQEQINENLREAKRMLEQLPEGVVVPELPISVRWNPNPDPNPQWPPSAAIIGERFQDSPNEVQTSENVQEDTGTVNISQNSINISVPVLLVRSGGQGQTNLVKECWRINRDNAREDNWKKLIELFGIDIEIPHVPTKEHRKLTDDWIKKIKKQKKQKFVDEGNKMKKASAYGIMPKTDNRPVLDAPVILSVVDPQTNERIYMYPNPNLKGEKKITDGYVVNKMRSDRSLYTQEQLEKPYTEQELKRGYDDNNQEIPWGYLKFDFRFLDRTLFDTNSKMRRGDFTIKPKSNIGYLPEINISILPRVPNRRYNLLRQNKLPNNERIHRKEESTPAPAAPYPTIEYMYNDNADADADAERVDRYKRELMRLNLDEIHEFKYTQMAVRNTNRRSLGLLSMREVLRQIPTLFNDSDSKGELLEKITDLISNISNTLDSNTASSSASAAVAAQPIASASASASSSSSASASSSSSASSRNVTDNNQLIYAAIRNEQARKAQAAAILNNERASREAEAAAQAKRAAEAERRMEDELLRVALRKQERKAREAREAEAAAKAEREAEARRQLESDVDELEDVFRIRAFGDEKDDAGSAAAALKRQREEAAISLNAAQINRMTKMELETLLKDLGLNASGYKADLIKRLKQWQKEHKETEPSTKRQRMKNSDIIRRFSTLKF